MAFYYSNRNRPKTGDEDKSHRKRKGAKPTAKMLGHDIYRQVLCHFLGKHGDVQKAK